MTGLHPTPVLCQCGTGRACPVPHDVWLATGAQPGIYPCRCETYRACRPAWCPCAGRLDLENVPPACCARINTPAVVMEARREYERWKRSQNR